MGEHFVNNILDFELRWVIREGTNPQFPRLQYRELRNSRMPKMGWAPEEPRTPLVASEWKDVPVVVETAPEGG